jgi:hypothetical protein
MAGGNHAVITILRRSGPPQGNRSRQRAIDGTISETPAAEADIAT